MFWRIFGFLCADLRSVFEADAKFIMVFQCINPDMSRLVMHSAGGISVWYTTNRGDVDFVR